MENELRDKYFDWMYQLVCDKRYSKRLSYLKLLHRLHDTEFIWVLPMDANRADDGTSLRYRFGDERGYPQSMVASYLDDRPCSVLEMMIALAIRCEEHIMDNQDYGDRTGQWFWNMIVNLGLNGMNDDNFDVNDTDRIVSRFLNREYRADGNGGLFAIEHCRRDLRAVEIWYQMDWYLNTIV